MPVGENRVARVGRRLAASPNSAEHDVQLVAERFHLVLVSAKARYNAFPPQRQTPMERPCLRWSMGQGVPFVSLEHAALKHFALKRRRQRRPPRCSSAT
jgi:hypothetical protein